LFCEIYLTYCYLFVLCHPLFVGCLWLEHSFQTRSGGRPGLRLGFRVLTGSIFFLKKSKRRRFSKKKKVNRLQPSFLPGLAGSIGSRQIFPYPIFSSTRPGSSPGSANSLEKMFSFSFGIACLLTLIII